MADPEKKPKYCLDTSALVDSWRRYYQPHTFDDMWARIKNEILSGSILVPDEVRKEVKDGDDLAAWFKDLSSCIVPVSVEQLGVVSEIVNKYPLVSQYKKPRPYHADPFVVAVAKITGTIVVTYETKNGSQDHPKVPDLCKEHNVECISMSDFFSREGWRFNLK